MANLKKVYAVYEQTAAYNLEIFDEKWGVKHPKMRAYRKLCKPLLSDKINNGGFSYGKERKESHADELERVWGL